jgi:flagellar hook-associated protein 3 FlgL
MDRVSTLTSYSTLISSLMQSEVRQADAQAQVSTGKVASDLKGFGSNAEALTATQTVKTRVDGFVQNAKALSSKLSAQDLALTQVSEAASGARQAIANAVATGHGDGLMASLQSYLDQASSALNTQYSGQYLFAGGRVDIAPVDATYAFQNDQNAPVSRLDESTTVTTGVLASDAGGPLLTAIAAVVAYDAGGTGPLSGQLTQTQIDYLTTTLAGFDTARVGIDDKVAQNGMMQNRVARVQSVQQDRQMALEVMIGNVADADMAKAASQLSQAQVVLQASAQVFATLKSSSLLNYLRLG